MESLGRGLVAVNQGDGNVFVSWRLLGNDPGNVAFNIYRVTGNGRPVRLNREPITKATCYRDAGVDQTRENAWFVRPVVNGAEGELSKPFLNRIAANAIVTSSFATQMQVLHSGGECPAWLFSRVPALSVFLSTTFSDSFVSADEWAHLVLRMEV